jgi:hybrid cluster-associated redox disulfide protein
MHDLALGPDMTIDAIMRRWPSTIPVVIGYGMLCVRCPIGRFHTLREACRAHEISEEQLMRDLAERVLGGLEVSVCADVPRSASDCARR